MPNSGLILANCWVRPARPADRQQIRLLLRSYHHPTLKDFQRLQFGQSFCLGLFVAFGLHGLLIVGGVNLLWFGLLIVGTLALTGWLGLHLLTDWQHYWVVEYGQRLIACGKLVDLGCGSILCDVVVGPEHRQQGVGSLFVNSMVTKASQPLYLACTLERLRFYQRLGFEIANPEALSMPLKVELGLPQNSKLMALQFSPK
jgi:N-acetylglutamate synthase-like GNAT family acetyltransferase